MRQANGSSAWSEVEFDSIVVRSISNVNVKYNSVRVLVAASWERRGFVLEYNVTVPVGSLGTVHLPGAMSMVFLDGSAVLRHRDVVEVSGSRRNKIVVRVASGAYSFIVDPSTIYFST